MENWILDGKMGISEVDEKRLKNKNDGLVCSERKAGMVGWSDDLVLGRSICYRTLSGGDGVTDRQKVE